MIQEGDQKNKETTISWASDLYSKFKDLKACTCVFSFLLKIRSVKCWVVAGSVDPIPGPQCYRIKCSSLLTSRPTATALGIYDKISRSAQSFCCWCHRPSNPNQTCLTKNALSYWFLAKRLKSGMLRRGTVSQWSVSDWLCISFWTFVQKISHRILTPNAEIIFLILHWNNE